MENTGWQVEHQCPQCGGTVNLQEAQRLFVCPFCRVRLFINTNDVFRYFLAPAPGSNPIVYAPYRRFKGMFFSYADKDVHYGLIDISRNVSPLPFLPSTLGLRAGALKLRFVSSETTGRFLAISSSLNDTLVAGTGLPQTDRIYIGETTTMIYTPIFMQDGCVRDAVVGEKISTPSDIDADAMLSQTAEAGEHFKFIPSLCPDCGWDLEGDPLSVVLCCRNCASAWQPVDSGFEKVACCYQQLPGDHIRYLPFWKMEVEMEGMAKSYAEAMRLLNLPKVIPAEWEKRPFTWMIPAFKINPETYLRVSKTMSLTLSEAPSKDSLPEGDLHPVTLGLTEAFESLKIAFAYSAISKFDMALLYPRLHPVLTRADLLYYPFVVSGLELIRPDRQLSINSNALKWGATV